jgi:GNAT superfamily N-acetyltransferase
MAISAWRGQQRLGGLVIAHGSDAVEMLEGRRDLAVIWDIRVRLEERGSGVGSHLVAAAENWARSKGCSQLKVETQNINVPACRFYARNGFRIGSVDPHAYPDLPNEIQMLWYKDI